MIERYFQRAYKKHLQRKHQRALKQKVKSMKQFKSLGQMWLDKDADEGVAI